MFLVLNSRTTWTISLSPPDLTCLVQNPTPDGWNGWSPVVFKVGVSIAISYQGDRVAGCCHLGIWHWAYFQICQSQTGAEMLEYHCASLYGELWWSVTCVCLTSSSFLLGTVPPAKSTSLPPRSWTCGLCQRSSSFTSNASPTPSTHGRNLIPLWNSPSGKVWSHMIKPKALERTGEMSCDSH